MRHPISRLFSIFSQVAFANRHGGPSKGGANRGGASNGADSRGDDTVVLYARINPRDLEGDDPDESTRIRSGVSTRIRSGVSTPPADTTADPTPDTNANANIDTDAGVGRATAIGNQQPPRPTGSHRERLLSMRLSHLRLLGPRRRERLEAAGIVTAGDLLMADLPEIRRRMGADERKTRWLARHRRAIRLAAAVPGMMPRDALLLTHVHRRSLNGLAAESPAALHRDLERFALSSDGQRLLRGRPVPSVRRVRSWIRASAAVAGVAATTPTRIERADRNDRRTRQSGQTRRRVAAAPAPFETMAR